MENQNLKSNSVLYTSIIIILLVIIIIFYIIFKLNKLDTSTINDNIPTTNNNIPTDNTNNIPTDNTNNIPTDNIPTDNTNNIAPTDNTNNIPTDNNTIDTTPTDNSTVTPIIDLTFPKSTTKWKQVCYIGNNMTVNSFNYFIDIAKNAGITHIVIHFLLCDLNNNKLTSNGTVNAWQNFTNAERELLVNKINGYGIVLMASFGGNDSFPNGFNEIFNSNYKNYEILANELMEWMILNKIYGIDIDIGKNSDITDTYIEYRDKISIYLGLLSTKIKIMGQQLGFYIHISHSILPQFIRQPYHEYGTRGPGSAYTNIYNNLENNYKSYIDFYNIKYYDTDLYYSYHTIFIDDVDTINVKGNITAVSQIIGTGFNQIPDFKIVVGKLSEPPSNDSSEFIKLYSKDSRDTSSFNYFIKKNNMMDSNPKLQKWFTSGGIMIWEYKNFDNGELDTTNEYNKQIIDIFTGFK